MRIAVIGAGAVGALIARELTRYEVEVLLFEREADVGWGVTKANSAIVHGGFHDRPGTVRARFCVAGNAMFDHLCEELDTPFRRVGAYVLALSEKEISILEELRIQGEENGVAGLVMHQRDEVLEREPHVSPKVRAGLWSPTVGITEPWAIAIAAVENAVENGLELHLSEEVTGIRVGRGCIQEVATPQGDYPVDAVMNAAGLYADWIAAMVGLSEPVLLPRRGEYMLLDKKAGSLVRSVLFPSPREKSKGILVLPTIDGGTLLGPTAEDLPPEAKEAVETTPLGLQAVIKGARRLVPKADCSLAIKTFAGLRPESPQKDFVVGETPVRGFYQAAAMRSPGLTAAPAIARWLVQEVMTSQFNLKKKSSFQPVRKALPKITELPQGEWEALIRKDPRFGRIVCYCNEVTEGEIVDAIHRGAQSVDGVKFRTRAGFGCCQGAFCITRILALLARELEMSIDQVPLRGAEAWLVNGKVRP